MSQRFASLVVLAITVSGAVARAEPVGAHPLTGPSASVTTVAWSPDGKTLASGGLDRFVRLYDAKTGATRHQLDGLSGAVRSVAWVGDGHLLVAAAENSPLLAWTAEGAPVWKQPLAGRVSALSLAPAPDGKSFAAGCSDGSVRLHDAATGKPSRTLPGGKAPAVAVAWSPDGQLIAAGSKSSLQLWNVKTGKQLRSIPMAATQAVFSVAFDRTSVLVATGMADGEVRLWRIADGKIAGAIHTQGGAVKSVVFSAENDVLTGGADHLVRKWSGVTGEEAFHLPQEDHAINAAIFSPDGRQVAAAGENGSLTVWDAAMRTELYKLQGPAAPLTGVAYVAGLNAIAGGTSDGNVYLWDGASGVRKWSVLGHGGPATAVVASPDGRYIFTAGGWESPLPSDTDGSVVDPAAPARRGRVMIWNAADSGVAAGLGAHPAPVTALAISSDGRSFVSASDGDPVAIVWDTADHRQRLSLAGHSGPIRAVAIGPGGETVASGSADGTVRLWSGQVGGTKQILRLGGPVDAVALSPDGQILATSGGQAAAGGDHPITLWDVSNGKPLRMLNGHRSRVTSLTFSRDGWYLASASRAELSAGKSPAIKVASEARVWLVQTGAATKTITATSEAMQDITSLAFAPDVRSVALGCADHQVWLWNAK